MKKVSDEIFVSALNKADLSTQELLYSDIVYTVVLKLLAENNLEKIANDTLLPLGYNFLKIHTLEETLSELTEVGVPDPYGFLKKVQELTKATQNLQPTDPPHTALTAENLNLRTMPMDIQHAVQSQPPITPSEPPIQTPPAQAPVYQSSQATILNQPAPQPPPYTPPTPRWDTDNRQ
jgi:hypothetical protein